MATFTYDSLATAAGTDLGYSRWLSIDQPRINAFAEVTEDRQWIHVDPERAAGSTFGSTIAHGYLTLALVAGVLDEIFQVEGIEMSINYGIDRVRFPTSVPSGSQIRGHGQIVEVQPVPSALQVTIRVAMQTNGADRPACIADTLTRVIPKPPRGPSRSGRVAP